MGYYCLHNAFSAIVSEKFQPIGVKLLQKGVISYT